MGRRSVLSFFILLLWAPFLQGQTFSAASDYYLASALPESKILSNNKITARGTIESILENPAVLKKEMAQNVIRAIGQREDNREHFVIHFKKRQLHGGWLSYFTNGQLCDSGSLHKNLPDGEWRTWYSNGQLKSITTYSAEKFGFIKNDIERTHPRFQRYALSRNAPNKAAAARHFKPKFHSLVKDAESLSMLQKIEHNTTHNGDSYIAPFMKCLHHGMYISYFENGAVKDSGHYVNGLKHGLWEETINEGGTTAFGLYKHGKKSHQWKYYDKAGNLIYTENYNSLGQHKGRHHFKK